MMKRGGGMRVILLACVMLAVANETPAHELENEILEELRAIRVAVEDLRDQVADLRKQRTPSDRAGRTLPSGHAFTSRGPDIETLRGIELPDKDDPEQVKRYISMISAASQGQNTFSDDDPQIRMLMDLGEENVPLLIDSLRYSTRMSNYHIRRAIVMLASENNKELILEALPVHRGLVSAVLQQGWAADARDTLVTELRHTGQYLPTEWIQAVASLRDPETYSLLLDYFVEGQNRAFTYRTIRNLPIENMSAAVEQAWNRSKHSDDYARISMATIALEYGYLDALETLADALTYESTDSGWLAHKARPAVLRHTEFRGANHELMPWFRENHEKLEFNPENQRFEIR